MHVVIGWCPPLPIIRRLGIRTPEEINAEKTITKFLRGDFVDFPHNPIDMIDIIEKDCLTIYTNHKL